MTQNFSALKQSLDKDIYTKERVSFNFPKYEEIGTPHDVWMTNTSKVEYALDNIINSQPFPEEHPLAHVREEEKDDDGRTVRIHFDLYGKSILVKNALAMLNSTAVQIYMTLNMANSDKAPEMLTELQKMISENPNAEVIAVTDPSKAKEEILKYLEAQGIDTKGAKITKAEVLDEDGKASGEISPLNLGEVSLESAEPNVPFIMPAIDDDVVN